MSRTKTVGVRLTPEEYARLVASAAKAGVPPTTYAYTQLMLAWCPECGTQMDADQREGDSCRFCRASA